MISGSRYPINNERVPLIETEASMRPMRVVGTRIKLVVRLYDAHAYPVTSVHSLVSERSAGETRKLTMCYS